MNKKTKYFKSKTEPGSRRGVKKMKRRGKIKMKRRENNRTKNNNKRKRPWLK